MGLDALARGKDPDEAFGGGGHAGFGGANMFSQKDAEKMFKSMVSALSNIDCSR
jgi:nanoRNase/pAp phosphatase (c-di-AMP/oligoRNAs hydrolase)